MFQRFKNLFYILIGLALYCLVISFLHTTCIIKWLTGISCGGCGMSRAFLSLLKGDIYLAFYYHPLFPLVIIYALLYLFKDYINPSLFKLITAIVIIAFVGTYIYRLLDPNCDVVTINLNNSAIFKMIRRLLCIVQNVVSL